LDVPDEANVMWYDLDVENGGSAYLWLLGNGPDSTSDTVFVSVNGGPDQVVTLAPAAWAWTRAATAFDLLAGKQTLKIKASKPGAQLDRIWLTSDGEAAAPDGLGAASPDKCGKGQVPEPVNGDGAGMGDGSGGFGGVAAGDPESQTPVDVGVGVVSMGTGGAGTGAAGSAGADTPFGSDGAAVTAAGSDEGCGCRMGASSQPESQTLGFFGILSALSVAAARRSRRNGSRRFR
ncbi:MAG: hypothetical protein ABI895_00260, partial [Deltaproteobacteria bacterium]